MGKFIIWIRAVLSRLAHRHRWGPCVFDEQGRLMSPCILCGKRGRC